MAEGREGFLSGGAGAETLAVPKLGMQTVRLAPPAPESIPLSHHTVVAAEVEDGMIGTMQELRIATVQANQELEEELVSVTHAQ